MTRYERGHNATRRYFDNAATSRPKPDAVAEAMARFAAEFGVSPGRGGYREVAEAAQLMRRCRQRLCDLFNGEQAEHVVFTLNTTDALNLAIKGIVRHHRRAGRPIHLVTSDMDHNSVLRPFNALAEDGDVHITRVPVDRATGLVDPKTIEAVLTDQTRLVAIVHGSNVTGTTQDIAAIGGICRRQGIPLLVDAAQTLGHMPIDAQAMDIELLAFPGHKGLLGPLGTGGLYIRPGVEAIIDTTREGGTGTISEHDVQPDFLPDKYEAGSHNAIGIAGLLAGVEWILDQGVDTLWRHERALMQRMLDGLHDIAGLTLLGPQTLEHRCGVFSVVSDDIEPDDLAARLEREHGILTRAGIHCAPGVHGTMGTADRGGATRLSLGPFLSESDIDAAIEALRDECNTPSSRNTHAGAA